MKESYETCVFILTIKFSPAVVSFGTGQNISNHLYLFCFKNTAVKWKQTGFLLKIWQ